MKALLQKWWVWVLLAAAIHIVVAAVWGLGGLGVIYLIIAGVLFGPPGLLVIVPMQKLGWLNYFMNELGGVYSLIPFIPWLLAQFAYFWLLDDVVDAVFGNDDDLPPEGKFRQFFYRWKVWWWPRRYMRKKKVAG